MQRGPTTMTTKRFYRVLNRLGKTQSWGNRHGQIRGDGIAGSCDCPITAVALELTGYSFKIADYVEAARDIGLSKRVAKVIAEAADFPTSTGDSRYVKDHRRRLLLALKLKEI